MDPWPKTVFPRRLAHRCFLVWSTASLRERLYLAIVGHVTQTYDNSRRKVLAGRTRMYRVALGQTGWMGNSVRVPANAIKPCESQRTRSSPLHIDFGRINRQERRPWCLASSSTSDARIGRARSTSARRSSTTPKGDRIARFSVSAFSIAQKYRRKGRGMRRQPIHCMRS